MSESISTQVSTLRSAPSAARSAVGTARSLDRAPFQWTQRDRHTLPVETRGTLPEWLQGDLVRTAPAVFDHGGWQAAHWFDGLALIYGFVFDGRSVSFKQRLLGSRVARELEARANVSSTFGTATERGLLARLFRPIPDFTDNTNVNIVPWQGAWLAMTETPYQHVIDGDTLQTRGLYTYEDDLPDGLPMLAHPHFDFSRGAMVNLATRFGPKSELWVIRQAAGEKKRVVEGKVALKRVPYVHDFGMTDRSVVVIDHPLRWNPITMLFSNRPLAEHFKWEPRTGTKLWKLDRRSGRWSAYETEALFCFHVVNTYEDGADTVFDFLAYDDASVIDRVRTERLRDGEIPVLARYVRARLQPGKKRVEVEPLSSQTFEFPNIAYRAEHGRAYDVTWGAALNESAGGLGSTLLRLQNSRAEVRRFAEDDIVYGEPVFVPKPGAQRATEGVVLAVGSNTREDRARLAVLDADTLEPLARCDVPLALPLGFHGNFHAR